MMSTSPATFGVMPPVSRGERISALWTFDQESREPCGDRCFHLEVRFRRLCRCFHPSSNRSEQLGSNMFMPLDDEALEEYKQMLVLVPDIPPCEFARLVRLPCAQVRLSVGS